VVVSVLFGNADPARPRALCQSQEGDAEALRQTECIGVVPHGARVQEARWPVWGPRFQELRLEAVAPGRLDRPGARRSRTLWSVKQKSRGAVSPLQTQPAHQLQDAEDGKRTFRRGAVARYASEAPCEIARPSVVSVKPHQAQQWRCIDGVPLTMSRWICAASMMTAHHWRKLLRAEGTQTLPRGLSANRGREYLIHAAGGAMRHSCASTKRIPSCSQCRRGSKVG
jgi:hypothetical protein